MTKDQNAFSHKTKFVAYGSSLLVKVATEDPSQGSHGIYFNRGAAGSHAYSSLFGEYRKYHLVKHFGHPEYKYIINPRDIPSPEKSKQALAWLSRGLEEALFQFLSQATGKGYQLRAAVYEFTHAETIQEFACAVERGADVKIIRHCKGTYRSKEERGHVEKDWIPDEASDSASKAIEKVSFHSREDAQTWQHSTFIERRHSSALMHNKFIILMRNGMPLEVWTGSTNFTDSGIYGQSNVGHIVRDGSVAKKYLDYWNVLATDRPGRKWINGDEEQLTNVRRRENTKSHAGEKEPMDEFIENQQPDIEGRLFLPSIQVIFSPRKTTNMLQWYADRMSDAKRCVHFTEAFSISQPIAHVLNKDDSMSVCASEGAIIDKASTNDGLRRSPRIAKLCKSRYCGGPSLVGENTNKAFLRYVLLDSKPSKHISDKSRDSSAKKGKEYVDYYDFKDYKSNRIAYGAVLQNGLDGNDDKENDDKKAACANESLTGLTSFIDYLHTKYLIIDALTESPTVITGSANFSEASTNHNDENMLVIHGDTSVSDVYFTEFMRLFDHFYSRDKRKESKGACTSSSSENCVQTWDEIVEDETWLAPYFDPATQLYRERLILSSM